MTTGGAVVVMTDRLGNSLGQIDSAVITQLVWTLNDVGSAIIAVPTLDPRGAQLELMKNELQVWFGGNLVWWGFPESFTGTNELVTYTLSDLLGYMKYRFITNTSLTYTAVDQLTIMNDIVAQMQGGTYQDFHIGSASFSPSGIPRNRQYFYYDHKNALDLLKEFPGLNLGADYSIEIDNTSARKFTPWYPQKGSYKPNLALEWGKNILGFNNWTEDGTKLVTLDYCKGGSSAGVYFENHYEDTGASQYYGQFQAITNDSSEEDVGWLLAEAIQTVDNRNKPSSAPTVLSVNTPAQSLFPALQVGDIVPLVVNLGRLQANGEKYRIMQATWKPDGTYSLLLNRIPAAFVYPPPSPIL